MINLQLDEKDIDRFISAFKRVYVKGSKEVTENLQKKAAGDYTIRLIKNLLSGRYGGSYPEYNEQYARYKSQFRSLPSWWILTGTLLRNIKTFKHKNGYMGGIPSSATGERGKKVAYYGYIVEHGLYFGPGKKYKPRPLFGPTMKDYAGDQEGWRKRIKESSDKIRKFWR